MRGEGVRSDPVRAAHWYASASAGGNPSAQRHLARCYVTGMGVSASLTEAYKWATLASKGGDLEAVRLRSTLEPHLTARQCWDARRMAREWLLGRTSG
jgi:TPR repeat protein